MDKNRYLLVDTETVGGFGNPLVYDVGLAVVDTSGKIEFTKSFAISDIFYGLPALMNTAYISKKISPYFEEIRNGERDVVTIEYTQSYIEYLTKIYNIRAIISYNMPFDYRALNNTLTYVKGKKSRFFGEIRLWCLLKMVRQTVGKQKTYINWCSKHDFITKSGQPSLTVETLCRYIAKDLDYKEKHTGISDIFDEVKIFSWVQRQHKAMNRDYLPRD